MTSADIGRVIRLLREKKEMSQMALAEHLDRSYQQVQKYEKGESKITIEILSRVSRIFSISFEELFSIARESDRRESDDEAVTSSLAPQTELSGTTATEVGSSSFHYEGQFEIDTFRERELLREYRGLSSPLSKELSLRYIKGLGELEEELTEHKQYKDPELPHTDQNEKGQTEKNDKSKKPPYERE